MFDRDGNLPAGHLKPDEATSRHGVIKRSGCQVSLYPRSFSARYVASLGHRRVPCAGRQPRNAPLDAASAAREGGGVELLCLSAQLLQS
jgi:hypothetical protein